MAAASEKGGGGGSVDPDELSRALTDLNDFKETAARPRERTPGGSPNRKRQRVYGDR
jgi:cell division cycle 20-like protein 1, cofactor of APC complex